MRVSGRIRYTKYTLGSCGTSRMNQASSGFVGLSRQRCVKIHTPSTIMSPQFTFHIAAMITYHTGECSTCQRKHMNNAVPVDLFETYRNQTQLRASPRPMVRQIRKRVVHGQSEAFATRLLLGSGTCASYDEVSSSPWIVVVIQGNTAYECWVLLSSFGKPVLVHAHTEQIGPLPLSIAPDTDM